VTRILLIEDDRELAATVCTGLQEQGFDVVREGTYREGLATATYDTFDVILLDVMLPGGSGFDLCRELRLRKVATPVLMLTARDTVDDRLAGFDVGGDDYLQKPFAFRELVARVRALARRRTTLLPEVIRVADLEVDFGSHHVMRGGRPITLTAKEFTLLEFLLSHRNQVVDRMAITAYVWDGNHDPDANVLDVLIRRLRRKLDDGFEPKLIHTLRGAGYRFGA
jgi:two-component system copper resistance phosphate regulon response regulator CusR